MRLRTLSETRCLEHHILVGLDACGSHLTCVVWPSPPEISAFWGQNCLRLRPYVRFFDAGEIHDNLQNPTTIVDINKTPFLLPILLDHCLLRLRYRCLYQKATGDGHLHLGHQHEKHWG